MEVSGQHHAPAALPPGKSHVTDWIGGWWVTEPIETNLCVSFMNESFIISLEENRLPIASM
jgi:hypothetical protein